MDVHSKSTRSYNMSRIRSRDTGPERRVRSVCHRLGLRYRLNVKTLPGKPDIVFPKHQTIIFVNGCYWHMHECRFGQVVPKTNTEFWQRKRNATVARDRKKTALLEQANWRVLTVWECETRDTDELRDTIAGHFGISLCSAGV
ncbi:MAG: very short patch repair endonuclease [Granulosicoccus sp.]